MYTISKKANDVILQLMRVKNISKDEMALKTGIPRSTFWRKLKGNGQSWSLREAISIANVFGLTVDDLFMSDSIPIGIMKGDTFQKIV